MTIRRSRAALLVSAVALVAGGFTAPAQAGGAATGQLTGVVTGPDGQPAPRIGVASNEIRTETDAEGSWTLPVLADGEVQVTFSDAENRYVGRRETVTVPANTTQTLNVRLAFLGPSWDSAPTLNYRWALPWGRTVTVTPGHLLQADAKITGIEWVTGEGQSREVVGTGSTYKAPGKELDGVRVRAEIVAVHRGVEGRIPSADLEVRDPRYLTGEPRLSTSRPAVHEVVVASTKPWSPSLAKISWRWFRDGRTIRGASGSRYRAVRADLGHRLSAEATLERPDEHPPQHARTPSRTVVSARAVPRLTLRSVGERRVRASGTVAAVGLERGYLDGTVFVYRSRRGSDRVGRASVSDGRFATTLVGQPRGRRFYWVRFVPSDTSIAGSTTRRAAVTVR